jgi:hypothetical protein
MNDVYNFTSYITESTLSFIFKANQVNVIQGNWPYLL